MKPCTSLILVVLKLKKCYGFYGFFCTFLLFLVKYNCYDTRDMSFFRSHDVSDHFLIFLNFIPTIKHCNFTVYYYSKPNNNRYNIIPKSLFEFFIPAFEHPNSQGPKPGNKILPNCSYLNC